MKNLLFLLLFSCISFTMVGQETIYLDDERLKVSPIKVQNKTKLLLDIKTKEFYIIGSNQYKSQNNLIRILTQKDSLNTGYFKQLNLSQDNIIDEYKQISNTVKNTIAFSNGQLSEVQKNLNTLENEIIKADANIESAKTDIDSSLVGINKAQKEISDAILDLNRQKKKFKVWIPATTGVIGFMVSMLIFK